MPVPFQTGTFLMWRSSFSTDCTLEVIEDCKWKRREDFADIQRLFELEEQMQARLNIATIRPNKITAYTWSDPSGTLEESVVLLHDGRLFNIATPQRKLLQSFEWSNIESVTVESKGDASEEGMMDLLCITLSDAGVYTFEIEDSVRAMFMFEDKMQDKISSSSAQAAAEKPRDEMVEMLLCYSKSLSTYAKYPEELGLVISETECRIVDAKANAVIDAWKWAYVQSFSGSKHSDDPTDMETFSVTVFIPEGTHTVEVARHGPSGVGWCSYEFEVEDARLLVGAFVRYAHSAHSPTPLGVHPSSPTGGAGNELPVLPKSRSLAREAVREAARAAEATAVTQGRSKRLSLVFSASGRQDTLDYRINSVKKGDMSKVVSLWHDVPLFVPYKKEWFDVKPPSVGAHDMAPLCNFICEIPKWTRKKYEIATGENHNPIKQDEKKGVLREVSLVLAAVVAVVVVVLVLVLVLGGGAAAVAVHVLPPDCISCIDLTIHLLRVELTISSCLQFKRGDLMFNYGCFPRTWEDPAHINPDAGVGGDNDPLDVCEIGMKQIQTGEVAPVKVRVYSTALCTGSVLLFLYGAE
jgi:inorganic pyrophosphatase